MKANLYYGEALTQLPCLCVHSTHLWSVLALFLNKYFIFIRNVENTTEIIHRRSLETESKYGYCGSKVPEKLS